MNWKANWIRPKRDMGEVVPMFCKNFSISKEISKATLTMTAMGVYEAVLNNKKGFRRNRTRSGKLLLEKAG